MDMALWEFIGDVFQCDLTKVIKEKVTATKNVGGREATTVTVPMPNEKSSHTMKVMQALCSLGIARMGSHFEVFDKNLLDLLEKDLKQMALENASNAQKRGCLASGLGL